MHNIDCVNTCVIDVADDPHILKFESEHVVPTFHMDRQDGSGGRPPDRAGAKTLPRDEEWEEDDFERSDNTTTTTGKCTVHEVRSLWIPMD